ncbi:probable cytochrome P450 6a13 [Nilaparvata lugens]|uniref:probable cytochrome P450 6a13 n=1 Tax=Nilaparvata lugens TaxID=108931 RepID=UPI00193E6D23|nr:probable cytochrome P450 6a13 [Nilaparvata lugens]
MDSGNPILICIGLLISFLITVAYVYCEWLYGYWKRKNVPHKKATSIIYGSIRKIFKGEESQAIFFKDIYEWKEARSKLTQALTVNKLKFIPESVSRMYPSMKTFLDETNDNIEAYELGTNITSGMAASWSWGIEDSGFTKTNSYVREIAQKFVNQFTGSDFSMQLILTNPWFTPLFRPSMVSQETGFFNDLTAKSLKMLISTVKDDAIKDLSGVVASFYFDAYETTARAMSFMFYSLAQYPDVQSRLREEVKKLSKEQITLEEVQKLPYLDMVFSEVLRMYPPATFLRKKCTQDCELSGVKVEAGIHIVLPILALHMDGDIYADPEKFDPERFSEENKNDRHPYAYIPFGSGPRMCPGKSEYE